MSGGFTQYKEDKIMANIFETESTSLQHHGILGQKWGVRRFENKNGHLTPAGKARYDDGPVPKKTQANTPKASSSSGEQPKKKLDKKKLIGAGMIIAGTALAAYGGYKMYQINQQNKATSQAISNATKALNEFKTAQSSMNRPNPIKPTSSGSSQNAAPKIDRATVSHTPIDRIQVDRTPIDRIQIDRFEPDRFGFEKFSAAADMNDSFVQDLLKKNSSKLKGY